MEMQTIMSSSSQMPPALADFPAADEAGGPQGKSAQPSGFGLLLDLCAETGGKGPTQAPLQPGANPEAAGPFRMMAGSGNGNVSREPGQAGPEKGTTADENRVNIGQAAITGLLGKVALEKQRPDGSQHPQASTENQAQLQTLPALPKMGQSSDSSETEKPLETGKEKSGTDSVWLPLLAVGNLFFGVNNTTLLPVSAEASLPQGNAQAGKEQDMSVNQPGNPVQAAAASAGIALADPAAVVPQQNQDTLQEPRKPLLKDAASNQAALPGSDPGAAEKTGMNAAIPQKERDSKVNAEIYFPGGKEMKRDPAIQASDKSGTREIGEPEVLTRKSVVFETARPGKGNSAAVPETVAQGKAPVMTDAAAAGAVAPERVEIVFSAETGVSRKDSGNAPTRKTREGKTTDSAASIAFATNIAESRSPQESRATAPVHETKKPSNEQIFSQVREKLDANGRASDNGQITLRLHPDDLGELKINMRLDDHNLKVEIVTQNQSVKEALMQNLDTLKETLSRQNIAMDRFDVSADPRQGFAQGGRDERQTTQENRGVNNGFQYAAEVDEVAAPASDYPWESENSLVNLML